MKTTSRGRRFDALDFSQVINHCTLIATCTFVALSLAPVATARPPSDFFSIPSSDSQPISITRGADGNLWFTEQNRSQVARITPEGVITEFLTPTFSFPLGITAGPDGNVWFSEGAIGQIAFITPSGEITEIPFSPSGTAGGIMTGPDGNIWFTDLTGNMIWRLELPSFQLTSFAIPTPDTFPNDITVGGDGNLWFTEGGAGKIGRITPGGVITEFGDGLSLPFSIVGGPDGNIWFVQRFTPKLGRITPAGDITFFPIPNPAEQISVGPGKRLLFTEFGSDRFGVITTNGAVIESPVFPNSGPTGIVRGPSKTVWFLGYSANRVYRVSFGP